MIAPAPPRAGKHHLFRLLAGAALAAAAVPAAAHDFWLEPSTYRVAPGSTVALRTRVGDGFRGDALPRNPRHLERFFVAGENGSRNVPGRAGADPVGTYRAGPGGFDVVGYASRPTRLVLPARRFDAYLRAEGLDDALAIRLRSKEASVPGREAYSRSAKALVRVEAGRPARGFDRRLGLPLEIVPENDPTRGNTGGETSFLLLHRGEPLAGARVSALPATEPNAIRAARTGADGRVRLSLDRPGRWLVKAVHITPAPAGSQVDWESAWATLTFDRDSGRADAAMGP